MFSTFLFASLNREFAVFKRTTIVTCIKHAGMVFFTCVYVTSNLTRMNDKKMQCIGRKQHRAKTNSSERNRLSHATMKINRMKGKKDGKESLFICDGKEVYDYYEYYTN